VYRTLIAKKKARKKTKAFSAIAAKSKLKITEANIILGTGGMNKRSLSRGK
jgi:hypothetical protein